MALVVEVPRTSLIADVDEALRSLLGRELGPRGYEGVEVHFECPSRAWSKQAESPAVNVFLHGVGEADERRVGGWQRARSDDGNRDLEPPSLLACRYVVTAWTATAEEEHGLLSQVLAVLRAHPRLPADVLADPLRTLAARHPVESRIGKRVLERPESFWRAVDGPFKASLGLVVTAPLASASWDCRGPEVRTQTLATRAPVTTEETSEVRRVGGRVLDGDGRPLRDAWVALPDHGRWATTDADGRFLLARVPEGRLRCIARAVDGREAEGELEVPGRGVDLVLADAPTPS